MDWATLGLACLLGVLEFRPKVNDTEVLGVMMMVGFGEKSITCFPPKTNKPEKGLEVAYRGKGGLDGVGSLTVAWGSY